MQMGEQDEEKVHVFACIVESEIYVVANQEGHFRSSISNSGDRRVAGTSSSLLMGVHAQVQASPHMCMCRSYARINNF